MCNENHMLIISWCIGVQSHFLYLFSNLITYFQSKTLSLLVQQSRKELTEGPQLWKCTSHLNNIFKDMCLNNLLPVWSLLVQWHHHGHRSFSKWHKVHSYPVSLLNIMKIVSSLPFQLFGYCRRKRQGLYFTI